MPPLYQQRAELIETNTDLLLQWLTLSSPETQRNIIRSMVKKYTLPQLRIIEVHLRAEVAMALAAQAKES
jgi:hypothetical protein